MESFVNILSHPFAAAFYGSFVYNLAIFVAAKNTSDKNGLDFQHTKYLKNNWDNWLLTVCMAPTLVSYMPDIVGIINDKLNWSLKMYKLYYMASGPVTELALFGVYKIMGWKDTFLAPGHK